MAKLIAASPGQRRRPLPAAGRRRVQPVRVVRRLHQHLPGLDQDPGGGPVPVLHRLERGVVLVPRRQGAGPLAGPAHGRAGPARREERGRRPDRRAALPGVLPGGSRARPDGLPRLADLGRRRRVLADPRVGLPRPARRRRSTATKAPTASRCPHFEPVVARLGLAGRPPQGAIHPRPVRGRGRVGRDARTAGSSATASRRPAPRSITSTWRTGRYPVKLVGDGPAATARPPGRSTSSRSRT